jgi:hypothetical protein
MELMDFFAEHQKKDFHMLKLKTKSMVNTFANKDKLFTIKAVETG